MFLRKNFLSLILAMLTACAPTTAAPTVTSMPATNTPFVSASTATPLVALTETALACPFEPPGKVPPPQFDEWCKTGCPLRQDQFTVITTSENAERCNGVFPRNSFTFSFMFPTRWMVHHVGAFSQNVLLETDKGQEILLVLETSTGLPLERADETKYYFAPDHPYHLVAPKEQRISKEIQTIGDNEALVLVTADGDLYIKRYFLINDNTLYMFQIEIPKLQFNDEATKLLFLQVEEIISSMQFVR